MVNRIQNLFPATRQRVERHTADHVAEKIRMRTMANVIEYATASPKTIDRRIAELEREWDTERALETGGAIHVFLGLALGTFLNRKWYAWAGVVGAFVLLHALTGWSPPMWVLRRRGFRTAAEISEEIEALRILRGDFHPTNDPQDAMAQARSPHRDYSRPILEKAVVGS